MTFLSLVGWAAALVGSGMILAWRVSLRRRDASLVDPLWGPAFLLVAGVGAVAGSGTAGRRALVVVLVATWALRLAAHLVRRSRGRGEDYRYRAMRERHGERFGWISLWTVFLLQGALVVFIGLPLLVATGRAGPPLGGLDLLGAGLWTIGFLFEAIGDRQLARFTAEPAQRGAVCDRGLWRYTRHPNYFGDATLWWGFYVIACAVPGGAWTLASPLLMTFLLLRVSGVALLEQGLRASKPGYAEYVARTSSFFPWPPRAR